MCMFRVDLRWEHIICTKNMNVFKTWIFNSNIIKYLYLSSFIRFLEENTSFVYFGTVMCREIRQVFVFLNNVTLHNG